jgi:archaellum component FlaF (FlaF/FlaG flagellin family)
MAEPTLQNLFGASATQTATTLTIAKADLTGLTPSANNTAESLLVAILLLAAENATQEAQDADPDRQIVIERGLDSLVTRNNQTYRSYSYTVDMQRIDTGSTVSPSDF